MCKSSKVNRRTVLAAIRSDMVTGTDERSCAVSVVAVLDMHPVHVGKVEEILCSLLYAGVIELRDAQMRCIKQFTVSPEEQVKKEQARPRAKQKFDRSAARKQGRINSRLVPPPIPELPKQWCGFNPDDYNTGGVDSVGGWDEDAVFEHHLMVCKLKHERMRELEACVASQVLDWSHEVLHTPRHDFILQSA